MLKLSGSVDGCLSAWLDWNNGELPGPFSPNGSFNDVLEYIIDNQPVTPGTNPFSFVIGSLFRTRHFMPVLELFLIEIMMDYVLIRIRST